LRRFLISYLTILLIPLALNTLIYQTSTTLVREYVESANVALISQAGYALDQRIESLRTLVLRVGADAEMAYLSNQKRGRLPPTFHIDLTLAARDLRPDFLLEQIITDYIIYGTNCGYIVDSSAITSDELFFRYSFRYDTWEFPDWQSYLTSSYHQCSVLPARRIRWGTESFTAVPLIWTVPFYLDTGNDTFIIFLIREQNIFDYFKPLTDEWNGVLSIYNADDQLITSSASVGWEPDPGVELTRVSVPSTVYNFRYELAVPVSEVYQKLTFIRRLMFAVSALAMVVGGLAAYWFAVVNSRPLRSMASLLSANLQPSGGRLGIRNPLDILKLSVSHVIATNESLQSRLADQKILINEVFFYRLLKEGFETRAEMRAMAKYLELPELAGMHGIALLSFLSEQEILDERTVEEMKGLKLLLLDTIRSESRYPNSWIDIGDDTVALLLTHSAGDREEWENRMQTELGRISERLASAVQFDFFWTIGNPVSDFFHVHSSYQQALELSRMLPKEERTGIHWYRDFATRRAEYYLPMDLLQRMYHLCRMGDFGAVEELFLENWSENTESRTLSPLAFEQYLLDLRGLLMRLEQELVDEGFMADLRRDDTESVREAIIDRLKLVCERVKIERQTSNARFKDEITAYLRENFTDRSLSLHSVASHFNISEGYLSHFFKKASGHNFYSFVEGLRLETAMNRLQDTRDAIKEIAYDVGYSSVQSFRRAFKRVYGVSPSTYREI